MVDRQAAGTLITGRQPSAPRSRQDGAAFTGLRPPG
jgi:hypothetical protein